MEGAECVMEGQNFDNAMIALQREQAVCRETLTRHDEQIKNLASSVQELKDLTHSVQELTVSVRELASSVSRTDERLDSVSADIREIRETPKKRWEKIIEVCITVVVTAVVTYFLTKAGLK